MLWSCDVNARNLSLLLGAYMARSDLNLSREVATNGKPMFGSTRTLKMPVLNMTGDHSPHTEATVAFNGRLQPNKCTWMKIQDSAMILEEQPGKVAEAVKLFLQGLGYVLRPKKAQSVSGTPIHRATSNAKPGAGSDESDAAGATTSPEHSSSSEAAPSPDKSSGAASPEKEGTTAAEVLEAEMVKVGL